MKKSLRKNAGRNPCVKRPETTWHTKEGLKKCKTKRCESAWNHLVDKRKARKKITTLKDGVNGEKWS